MNTKTLDMDELILDFRQTVGQEANITMVLEGDEDIQSMIPLIENTGQRTLGDSIGSNKSQTSRPRFIYEDALGEGAYGKVWKACDTDIGRSVAIKTYKMKGNQGYRLCASEVSIAAKIEHPGVPVLYDVEQSVGGEYHYIMKYVDGKPLDQIIKGLAEDDDTLHQRFRIEQRISVIIQVLRVLATVHKNGIVHRDIKPENILVGPNGEAYLMDWGIALDINQNNGEGQFAGTPMYMSPEQLKKEALGGRSDIYSVGSTMFELLTLQYYGPSFSSLDELVLKAPNFHRQKTDFPVSKTQQGQEIAMHIRKVIIKACDPNIEERYQTAEEFITALEDALAGRFDVCCPVTAMSKVTFLYQNILNTRPFFAFLLTAGSLFCFSTVMIGIGMML